MRLPRELGGQIRELHLAGIGEQRQAFDDIGELAHVPRPGVLDQGLAHRGGEARLRQAVTPRGAGGEVLGEESDVLAALAQRWQGERHDVQAVVEILAEAPGGDLGREVAVGRRDDAHVDRNLGGRADAGDLALLQRPQELRLQRERQLADLVEEDRAGVGGLEAPGAGAVGAGVGAAFDAEELGLEEPLGNRRAVDRHERLGAARR